MANPKIGTLLGFDTTNFNLGTASTLANGVLTVVPTADYNGGIVTKVPYDVAASAVYYRQNNSPGSSVNSNELFVGMLDTQEISYGFGSAQNILGWYCVGDAPALGIWLQPVVNVAGVDQSPTTSSPGWNPAESGFFTCSASSPLYIRIREAGGTTFYETSTDASTWTTLYSVADPLSTTVMGALYFALAAGFYGSGSGDHGVNEVIDKFNGGAVAPAANPGQFFPFIR